MQNVKSFGATLLLSVLGIVALLASAAFAQKLRRTVRGLPTRYSEGRGRYAMVKLSSAGGGVKKHRE
jgi:hypothetical protein